MSITERIQQNIKNAMKQGDKTRVGALRMLNAALQNKQIELSRALTAEEEQEVLRRQLKQREESSEAFKKAGRESQSAAEAAEADLIREYLPAPPSAEELEQIVDQALKEVGASSMKDMGAVMARATALAGNRATGRELAPLVRNRLQ